ncbi:MucR family transcriptional regulator [Sphingomonas sp. HMP6]|uniref:MucR family transcriptional regulator n=1 Tax=Sphingomonas sp. HMP6 TaxID=1517551 RepID=UPI00159668DF|nr:MucR family transcriptional regulator [Sphingomonas sp. HMP6]BCA57698.1 hypothetical protein HMP06_0467 [Sphingomonas sp. HMP6]
MNDHDLEMIGYTTEIVCAAFGGSQAVAASDIPKLIASTHAALLALSAPPVTAEPTVPQLTQREIRATITRAALTSLIDGKPYQMLRRHLSLNGHTPESYRALFGLPASYPMTAPGYSERRRQLAIDNGLGRKAKA